MEHTVRFLLENHSYFIDERPVPSVTQVLADLIPGWRAADFYLLRGRAIHAYAALIARGQPFDIPDTDPENRAYVFGCVAALHHFFDEVKPHILAVEARVFSQAHLFGGTLDLLIVLNGEITVLDFKATLTKAVPFQCAGYAIAYPETAGIKSAIRYGVGVEIRPDGKYQMGKITDLKLYKPKFLAMLSTFNSRRECGIAETKEDENVE